MLVGYLVIYAGIVVRELTMSSVLNILFLCHQFYFAQY